MEDDFVALHSTIRPCFDDRGESRKVLCVSLEGIFFFLEIMEYFFSSNLSKEEMNWGSWRSMKNK